MPSFSDMFGGYLTSTSVVLSVTCALCALFWINRKTSSVRRPPCVPALPIIGSIPFLSKFDRLHLSITEKSKQYGDVFAFYAGRRYTVVISGYQTITEALVKNSASFNGREPLYVTRYLNPELRGIITKPYGEAWKVNRQKSMAVLKEFGYGSSAVVEGRIHKELDVLISSIHDNKGKAFCPKDEFKIFTMGVIHSFLFGQVFDSNDAKMKHFLDEFFTAVSLSKIIYDIFPIITYLPSEKKDIRRLNESAYGVAYPYLIEKMRTCLAEDSEDESFVKALRKLLGDSYDEKEMLIILRDLAVAGFETISNQLQWAMVILGNQPQVQKQMQQVIDSVVPSDRYPSLTDRPAMPYVEAAILELLRVAPVVPLALPHTTLSDVELNGYHMSKGTTVIINIWGAHMDPRTFDEPEVFRPERFLDEKQVVINREKMITFSLGKRSCMGELLARQEIFLCLTAILQRFNILPPEGDERVSYKPYLMRVLQPVDYKIRLSRR